tara:strand:- start:229 stop:510 length:282 start_codon:yes stop_codon:yes gene_type:complete
MAISPEYLAQQKELHKNPNYGIASLPPMLILQSDSDDNIPLTIPERFVETYREKGGAVDITYFPGMPHAFAQQPGPNTDRAIGLMKDFLTRNV